MLEEAERKMRDKKRNPFADYTRIFGEDHYTRLYGKFPNGWPEFVHNDKIIEGECEDVTNRRLEHD